MIVFKDIKPPRNPAAPQPSPAVQPGKKLEQAKKVLARATPKPKGQHTMTKKTADKPKRAASGALTKPVTPGPALAAIVGAAPLPRTEIVKKLWDHIKAHNLQNPANKREINADDTLRPLFGKDSVTMFELNSVISKHVTA